MQDLFPDITEVGGEEMDGSEPAEQTYDSPRSYCTLAIDELGLETYSIDETIQATGDSYIKLGLLDV